MEYLILAVLVLARLLDLAIVLVGVATPTPIDYIPVVPRDVVDDPETFWAFMAELELNRKRERFNWIKEGF